MFKRVTGLIHLFQGLKITWQEERRGKWMFLRNGLELGLVCEVVAGLTRHAGERGEAVAYKQVPSHTHHTQIHMHTHTQAHRQSALFFFFSHWQTDGQTSRTKKRRNL